jgi:hypothetical protein
LCRGVSSYLPLSTVNLSSLPGLENSLPMHKLGSRSGMVVLDRTKKPLEHTVAVNISILSGLDNPLTVNQS